VKLHPDQLPTIEHVDNVETLKRFAVVDTIPADIALRLFLVEDMTAPVIEVLGSAYDCNPLLFAYHMYTRAARREKLIGIDGKPLEAAGYSILTPIQSHPEVYTPSEMSAFPFFSLPFRRAIFHRDRPETIKSMQQKRTIFRQLHGLSRSWERMYNEGARSVCMSTLEERVSGTIHISKTPSTHIGQCLASSYVPYSVR
jgi:hypothetical protein